MNIFYHKQPPNSSKCKFSSSILKNAFFNCHTCERTLSFSSHEDETPTSFLDDELQVVSITKARAMEARHRRKSILWNESFSSVFYPVTLSELFVRSAKQYDKEKGNCEMKQEDNNNEEKEEYVSAASHLSCSCCSIAASAATDFLSVRTSFSQPSSLMGVEFFPELKRRSIIQEFGHCEGWPFGLCRRALLLPPLPKSPSNSWSWCKGRKIAKTH